MVSRRGLAVALVLALSSLPLAALAQGGSLTASVDRDSIRENESFTYVLRAQGQLSGRPDLSALSRDFDVVDTSSTTRISIDNGRTTQIAEWDVELMPRGPGKFTLPPIALGNAMSNAVDLEILPALTDSDTSNDIFIEVGLDHETSFVQAQVIYTLKLFVAIKTGRATLTEPAVDGGDAIVEKLGQDRDYQSVRGGRVYNVRERSYAIFPQAAGKLRIGPAVFEATVTPSFGFSRQQRLRSDVVELDVKPAVAPPPEHPDAIWLPASDLHIEESWSDRATRFEQGVPRTRVLTIVADGLLETQLPDLNLGTAQGLRQYANQPELDREVTAGGIEARRTERYAVIAQQPGSVELPAVELPWWNVNEERWEVARLDSESIEVTPSASAAPGNEPAVSAAPAAAPVAGPGPGIWPWLSAAFAAAWLATLAAWLVSARLSRRRPPPPPIERGTSGRALLKQLLAACRVDDAPRTRNLLLEWAGRQFPDDPPGSLGALAARLSGPLGEAVGELEAALYGRGESAWRGQQLAERLRETQSVGRPADGKERDPLVPLYR